MKVLGIDTSCDDTSIAVLDGNRIMVNLVSSHLAPGEFGGVVPEYASRTHTLLLYPMLTSALRTADLDVSDIDLIAVTRGPGLLGSLLCGLSFAKGLSLSSGKPLRTVNHMEGHIYAVRLSYPHIEPPFLVLLVSGGHTELHLVEEEFFYREMGATLDDACGEALDKVGKLMGLGYPAGPAVEKLAVKSRNPVKLPRPKPKDMDFSYSGLKTAARNYLADHPGTVNEDMASGLQEAAFDHLVDRVCMAVEKTGVEKVGLGGGVAVNKRLRTKLIETGHRQGFNLFAPPPELCTDNAVMIAAAGSARFKEFGQSPPDEPAFDRASLGGSTQ